jgi:hypothetical protein
MPEPSTALTVKARLVELLPELAEVARSWGVPDWGTARDWVLVDRIDWSGTRWVNGSSREEEFTLTIVASVLLPGGTAEDTEKAAWALWTAAETAMQRDPSLGGLVVTSRPSPRRLASGPVPNGFEAELEGELAVTARVSRR